MSMKFCKQQQILNWMNVQVRQNLFLVVNIYKKLLHLLVINTMPFSQSTCWCCTVHCKPLCVFYMCRGSSYLCHPANLLVLQLCRVRSFYILMTVRKVNVPSLLVNRQKLRNSLKKHTAAVNENAEPTDKFKNKEWKRQYKLTAFICAHISLLLCAVSSRERVAGDLATRQVRCIGETLGLLVSVHTHIHNGFMRYQSCINFFIPHFVFVHFKCSRQVCLLLVASASVSRRDAKVRIHLLTSVAGATNCRTTAKHTIYTVSLKKMRQL